MLHQFQPVVDCVPVYINLDQARLNSKILNLLMPKYVLCIIELCKDLNFHLQDIIIKIIWYTMIIDLGMSLNCAPTRVCRKSTSRPGYVVKVRPDPGYVVKQCPRIVMNKIFDWH